MLHNFTAYYSHKYYVSILQLQHTLRHSIWILQNLLSWASISQMFHDLAYSLDNKGQSDIVLLDFSKAFDKVSHHLLLTKLQHYGIWGNVFLTSYYYTHNM